MDYQQALKEKMEGEFLLNEELGQNLIGAQSYITDSNMMELKQIFMQ